MLTPFEVLFEAEHLPEYPLPVDLKHVYGRLGFRKQVVYSNFVFDRRRRDARIKTIGRLRDQRQGQGGSLLDGTAARMR